MDDGSKDNSTKIIKNLSKKDQRVHVFFLKENVGAAEARNFAIRKAKGRYIAFLDSDDLWDPKKLEIQISFMSKNNIAFSYTHIN